MWRESPQDRAAFWTVRTMRIVSRKRVNIALMYVCRQAQIGGGDRVRSWVFHLDGKKSDIDKDVQCREPGGSLSSSPFCNFMDRDTAKADGRRC